MQGLSRLDSATQRISDIQCAKDTRFVYKDKSWRSERRWEKIKLGKSCVASSAFTEAAASYIRKPFKCKRKRLSRRKQYHKQHFPVYLFCLSNEEYNYGWVFASCWYVSKRYKRVHGLQTTKWQLNISGNKSLTKYIGSFSWGKLCSLLMCKKKKEAYFSLGVFFPRKKLGGHIKIVPQKNLQEEIIFRGHESICIPYDVVLPFPPPFYKSSKDEKK